MDLTTAEIWDRFHQQLRGFIVKRVENPEDADDILQEVFIKIHTHLDSLKDENRLAPWLFQVARNAIADYYRKQHPAAPLPDTLAIEPEPIEAEPEAQIASGLQEMLACLPEKYRTALTLTEIEGLSQVKMAEHLGLTWSGAKSRVQRGRAMLKEALLACCHFEFDRRGVIIDYQSRPDCCPTCRGSDFVPLMMPGE